MGGNGLDGLASLEGLDPGPKGRQSIAAAVRPWQGIGVNAEVRRTDTMGGSAVRGGLCTAASLRLMLNSFLRSEESF